MSAKYIAIREGVFADGKGTPSYQIYVRQPDGTYNCVSDLANDPVRKDIAIERARQYNLISGVFVAAEGK